jgi:murein DD-endopeptidase MepM/ murein hydrolase activator NlpD
MALVFLLCLASRATAERDAGGGATPAPAPRAPELGLPFAGTWGVLQGFDSGETHTGYAAFALDFVPPQPKLPPARARHPRLEDFACYGRPVLAAADGTVVRVARRFPDLPPYARRQPRHGGNFVIIRHAPGVYTEMVHLQAGSVRLAIGDSVRRGDVVGRCGCSGNATTPHLHLGLLTSIDPITTGRMKLSGYEVLGQGGRWLPGDGEPHQGQWVRPAAAAPAAAPAAAGR